MTASRRLGRSRVLPEITVRGLLRFVEQQVVRTPALVRSALISGAIRPLFYLVVLGLGLGELIGDADQQDLAGGDYVSFAGPGLLAAAAVEWAFGNGLWPTAGELRWHGGYRSAAVTPLSIDEIATGHVVWWSARFVAAAVPFTAVLVALGVGRSITIIGLPLAAGLVVAALLSWTAGFVGAVNDEPLYPIVLRLVMMPMFLFSGAFFPLDTMPTLVRFVAMATPAWHGVELCRDLAYGQLAGSWLHVSYLVAVMLTGWIFMLAMFRQVLEGERP